MLKSTKLKEVAKGNVTAVKSKVISKGKKEETIIKQGIPLDKMAKTNPKESVEANKAFTPKVGLSLGSTINMDNFESLRVDCWLTDEVRENETVPDAMTRIRVEVESVMQDLIAEYKAE